MCVTSCSIFTDHNRTQRRQYKFHDSRQCYVDKLGQAIYEFDSSKSRKGTLLENLRNSRKFPSGISGTVDCWEFPGIPVLDFPVEITACTGNKVKHGVKKLVSTWCLTNRCHVKCDEDVLIREFLVVIDNNSNIVIIFSNEKL